MIKEDRFKLKGKAIVLPDTHYDDKSKETANEKDYHNRIKIMTEQVIPYCIENNIKTIIQLGDITTHRTYISTWILDRLMIDIFDVLEANNIEFITVLGNHDLYYKDKRDVYTLRVFEKAYKNFHVVKDTEMIRFNDNEILAVPWIISSEDKMIAHDAIMSKDIDLIVGHFEIKDFSLTKAQKAEKGLPHNFFRKIPVLSGHFHLPQETNNIHYIGLIAQSDWNDFNVTSGFYVLNEDLSKTFIENTSTFKHLKVIIREETKEMEIIGAGREIIQKIGAKTDYSIMSGQRVKIFYEKDNAWHKKVFEKIIEVAYDYRLEFTPKKTKIITGEDGIEVEVELDESEVTELVTNEFNIDKSINDNLDTEYEKQIFKKISEKADIDMKDIGEE